jgi:hypothetical protein
MIEILDRYAPVYHIDLDLGRIDCYAFYMAEAFGQLLGGVVVFGDLGQEVLEGVLDSVGMDASVEYTTT